VDDSRLDIARFDQFLRLTLLESLLTMVVSAEGALNESLYFQFADRAVGVQELRFMVEHDGINNRLGTLCERVRDLVRPLLPHRRAQIGTIALTFVQFDGLQIVRPSDEELSVQYLLPRISYLLGQLLNAIRYRALSVASDEALCLSTFLEVDICPILQFNVHEERMRTLWQLVGERYNGVPAEMIFFMGHDTLGFPGWRWAPSSFLISGSDATWTIQDRLYAYKTAQLGIIRPKGLEVCFPGWIIKCQPWFPGLRLDVWEHLAARPHYPVVMRDSSTQRLWMLSLNLHGTPMTLPDISLRHILAQSGEFVLIRSRSLPRPMTILARSHYHSVSLSNARKDGPIQVEFVASVVITELFDVYEAVYEPLIALSKQVASHESSVELSAVSGVDISAQSQELDKVRQFMQRIVTEHIACEPEYRQLALRFLDKGEGLDNLWEALPIVLPFEITFEYLSENERWIVD
jgi:hypothetical protein